MMTQKSVQDGKDGGKIDLHADINKIKDAFSQTAVDIKDKLKHNSEGLEDHILGYVREHPVKAVAFSMLAGMILAKILEK